MRVILILWAIWTCTGTNCTIKVRNSSRSPLTFNIVRKVARVTCINGVYDLTSNDLPLDLDVLDISGNNLTVIRDRPFNGSLKELRIAHNNFIWGLHADIFDGLDNLTHLSLVDNGHHRVDPLLFSKLPNLRSLRFEESIFKPHPIENFYPQRASPLTNLPPRFFALSNLETLRINGGDSVQVSPYLFNGCPNLRSLALARVHLSGLNFTGAGNLESLYLDNVYHTQLPENAFAGFGNLTTLQLIRNNLTRLPANAFNGSGNLETLWLYTNNITSLHQTTFAGLDKLKYLRLDDNNITSLPARVFDDLPSLDHLDLRGNHLNTSRSALGLRNNMRLELTDRIL